MADNQRKAVSSLKNVTLVPVVNGGHNLFDSPSPELRERIDAFMNGRAVSETVITFELPDLAKP